MDCLGLGEGERGRECVLMNKVLGRDSFQQIRGSVAIWLGMLRLRRLTSLMGAWNSGLTSRKAIGIA